MGPETVNKLKGSEIHGDFVGHDNINVNIMLFQDFEREFVVTHNANIKPVSYFTGRETELQKLRQRIEAGRKSVLVSGMGGIGKTHICRKLFEEYLIRHANERNGAFQHIGYIEYNGDMGSSLQNCLKFKEQDNPGQNQKAAWEKLEYLAEDGKLLLFVDNVDKPISADPGLQRLRGIPGAIVLTSRLASFCDEFEPYRIGFLGMEQCKEIYGKIRFEGSERRVNPEEVENLEYVIENLAGRHTITVEFLAHLACTKMWSVKRLREELEQKGFRLQFHKDGKLVNIQESYEALYDLSELTEAEQNILEAFSVFPYIPLQAEICNQWLLADAGVNEDEDIFMGLYQKGWLQFDVEQEGYALHPVFAQFICEKDKPSVETHRGLKKACLNCLDVIQNGSALMCQRYEAYAESIIKKMDFKGSYGQIEFLNHLAHLSLCMAEYEKAEKRYNELLEIYKSIPKENDLNIAIIYNNLSALHLKKGQYEIAEGFAQESLQIRISKLGEDHADTRESYNVLAGVFERQNRYAEAVSLYEKCISICEKVTGNNHLDITKYYNNLAYVYKKQREYAKAEELLMKSLIILESASGEHYPDIAMVFDNLAQVSEALGKYLTAESSYKESIKINRKMYGENHPEIAKNYHNLAGLYRKQKQYQKALDLFIKAYKIQSSKQDLDYRDTSTMYQSTKETYLEWKPQGDFEQWLEEQMKE